MNKLILSGNGAFRTLLLSSAIIALILVPQARSQEIDKFFKQNCSSCHWIGGGRLVGPDLQNVQQRQERDWLVRFILDPKAMLDAQDPYAVKLKAEANGAIMTNAPGITRELAVALLDLIEAESKLDSSQFAGTPAALEPFSADNAARGLELFLGKTKLTNDGPYCISCHSVNAVGSSLGGQLGPDLTGVFDRLNGRTAISAWLSAPPTPTMRSVFKQHQLEQNEIKYLAMFFESTTGQAEYDLDSTFLWIILIFCGLAGGVMFMIAFGRIWAFRFRAVRRPLIKAYKNRGES
ncbi:MAG: c-type cytochrome [candidate division Zixibacteria bacterium]|nr:c-type cytochrome [candidate division Zixibacteria bacterium]